MDNDTLPAAALAPRSVLHAHLTSWSAWRTALVSGLGGFLTILILATAADLSRLALLIAPFGASCVLVFALPQSPLAQPRNVIGGHLISATVGVLVYQLLGAHPWSFAVGVGLAIALMQITGTLHPPAGADPIVAILAKAAWPFLFTPVFAGAAAIVLVGVLYHRGLAKRAYPVKS